MIKEDLYKDFIKLNAKSIFFKLRSSQKYDDNVLDSIDFDSMKVSGESFTRTDVLKAFDEQWKQYYGDGRWGGYEFTRQNYTGSDTSYYCMSLNFAMEVIKLANKIIREIFKAVWTEQIFDCDDFADMAKSIVAWILYKCGIRNDGAGIGIIKVDYYKDNKLSGHALNCLPIYDNNKLKWFLYESQNTDIYVFPKDWQIHFFDI